MSSRLIVSCLTMTMLAVAVPNSQDASSSDEITIQSVLAEIQHGLADAQTLLKAAKLPPLKDVVLTLHTEFQKKGGGKINLLIFSFGKTWERQRSNELVLTLTPPPPTTDKNVNVAAHPGLSTALVQAITSAANGVQEAAKATPPLVLDSLKAEFGFVVSTSKEAGAKFEIAPVTVELSGDLTKKAVHTMAVTFATPKPDK